MWPSDKVLEKNFKFKLLEADKTPHTCRVKIQENLMFSHEFNEKSNKSCGKTQKN